MEVIILSIISFVLLFSMFFIMIIMHLKSRHAYKELIRAEKQMNIEIDLKINEIVKDLDAYHLFLSEKGESLLKFEKQLKEYRIMLEDLRKVILKNKDFSQN